MSQTRQQIIVTLTTMRHRTQSVGIMPDIADAVLAVIQRPFPASSTR